MGRRTCSEELQLCPERQTQTSRLDSDAAACARDMPARHEPQSGDRSSHTSLLCSLGQLQTHTASVALGAVRVGDRGLAQSLCGARHRPRRQTAFPHLLQAVDGRGGWHQLRSPASSAPGPPTPPSEKPGAARAGASPAMDHYDLLGHCQGEELSLAVSPSWPFSRAGKPPAVLWPSGSLKPGPRGLPTQLGRCESACPRQRHRRPCRPQLCPTAPEPRDGGHAECCEAHAEAEAAPRPMSTFRFPGRASERWMTHGQRPEGTPVWNHEEENRVTAFCFCFRHCEETRRLSSPKARPSLSPSVPLSPGARDGTGLREGTRAGEAGGTPLSGAPQRQRELQSSGQ